MSGISPLQAQKPVIAIIGAGFSGLMTAYQLLQSQAEFTVHLLDPRRPHGRGVAYQNISDAYLLNVPVHKMGAIAGQPEHFWNWLQSHYPGQFEATEFVPRILYGQYLDGILAQLQTQYPEKLLQHFACVETIKPQAGRVLLEMSDETRLWSDRVVLASGNQVPAHPQLASDDFKQLKAYFQNPWQSDCLQGLKADSSVLLLGSGLTMVDLVLGLRETGFAGPIVAISPHGFIPVAHRSGPSWPDYVEAYLAEHPWPQSLSQWFRLVRQQLTLASEAGQEWGAVTDVLRPYTPRIWQNLSLKDRKRFMAHLRHRLGVLRHRLPASCAEKLQSELAAGSLRIEAGQVLDLQPSKRGALVQWKPRYSPDRQNFETQRVINCTGPNSQYSQLNQPLFNSLFKQGLIQADPLGLGLVADQTGALLDQQGKASDWLYALGPPLRGRDWESIAVPEIRQQVARLAAELLSRLT